jgi:hypothetical protein
MIDEPKGELAVKVVRIFWAVAYVAMFALFIGALNFFGII